MIVVTSAYASVDAAAVNLFGLGEVTNITDVGTNDDTMNVSHDAEVVDRSSSSMTWHRYVVTALCGVGAVGNALTVVVLSRHRGVRRARNDQETAVYCGMVAMAFADTMFCLAMLPRGFIPDSMVAFVNGQPRFQLAYQLYSTGLVTTSALLGSWLVVATAGIRYIGICHPFRARALVNFRSTVATILSITAACIVCNLPSFWVFDVIIMPPLPAEVSAGNNSRESTTSSHQSDVLHVLDLGPFSHRTPAGYAFLWLRGLFGLFLPLGLLVFFNVGLINALRMSEQFTDRCARSHDVAEAAPSVGRSNGGDVYDDDDADVVYRRPSGLRDRTNVLLNRTASDGRQVHRCKSVAANYAARQRLQANDWLKDMHRRHHVNQIQRGRRWCSDRNMMHPASRACVIVEPPPPPPFPVSGRMKMSHVRRRNYSSAKNWLTAVLVLIVLFFLVLVFPSDLLDFASHIYTVIGGANPETLIAARPVTNLLQVGNSRLSFLRDNTYGSF